MPWSITTTMSQRYEFVELARQEGANIRELCRRYGIAAKTGYKWLKRYEAEGKPGLVDRSRRPKVSPSATQRAVAALVEEARAQHPTWGGRKLRHWLRSQGCEGAPAASTCTEILRRAQLLGGDMPTSSRPYRRFERDSPNDLWQTDYKGHIALQSGQRCHPLTVTDDYSRFNLVLAAHSGETREQVQEELTRAFRCYGLPEALLCDNAPPWGCPDPTAPYTRLTVWLLRLGVRVLHGRPHHPQTQGKAERFHRTLSRDLLSRHTWRNLAHCQSAFQAFRHEYNCQRPHDSLGGATPISRYRPSVRPLPDALPSIDYPLGTDVRVLRDSGVLTFRSQSWYVGRAFSGLPIGLRPDPFLDGLWHVFFALHHLGSIDLSLPPRPKHSTHSIYPPIAGRLTASPASPPLTQGKGGSQAPSL